MSTFRSGPPADSSRLLSPTPSSSSTVEGRPAPEGGTRRRGFLGWCLGGSSLPLVAAPVVGGLSACTLWDQGGASTPQLDLSVLDQPRSATLSAQARAVQWVPGRSPRQANAWSYVSPGTGQGVLPNHLGPVFNLRRGSACTVTWKNEIGEASDRPGALRRPPVVSPLDGDVCGNVQLQTDVALVTHLHGARVQGSSDGWPLAPVGFAGNTYGFPSEVTYTYPNDQRGAMLWYHDHALDHTGRHVHAGLAGLYFIRDAADDAVLALVGGAAQELPMVFSDRILAADELSVDYSAGLPNTDLLARPEFLGTSLFVNGHPATAWTLGRRTWRLRLLNASNSRTYAFLLCDPDAIGARRGQVWHNQALRVIGADGGLLGASVGLGATEVLLLAPGQRRDVLIDLSLLPATVKRLRLVNLNLLATLSINDTTPEAIYTTYADSVLPPSQASYTAADAEVYEAIATQPLTDAMRFVMDRGVAAPATDVAALDHILAGAAADDDFAWSGRQLEALPGVAFGPNRLVLLMSNTEGRAVDEVVNTTSGWADVQIFEMDAAGSDWQIPFAVDLATTRNPAAAGPAAATGYRLARRSFFASQTEADVTAAGRYPAVHAPSIRCQGGTYERWYVANLGNTQPQAANDNLPDMHPFHVHLVSFVVTRRWELSPTTGAFEPAAAAPGDIDAVARQDTVMIPSNQMVELLVYIPPGYSGQYAYHCHLLEHEDMCMMSHFEVTAAAA